MKMKNLQTKHGKWVHMGRQTDYMFEKKTNDFWLLHSTLKALPNIHLRLHASRQKLVEQEHSLPITQA